jgi:hypothetical protein
MKDSRIKAIAVDFIKSLKRTPEERKFEADWDDFGNKMNAKCDEVLKDFRQRINIK